MKLRDLIQFSDLPQAELARKLNCRESTINQWKNGKFQPRADFIKRICEIFQVSADELLEINIPKTETLPRSLSYELYRTITKSGEYNSDTFHQIATTVRKSKGGKVTELEIRLRDIAEVLYKIELTKKSKANKTEPPQLRLF